jgi:hypothetical protein
LLPAGVGARTLLAACGRSAAATLAAHALLALPALLLGLLALTLLLLRLLLLLLLLRLSLLLLALLALLGLPPLAALLVLLAGAAAALLAGLPHLLALLTALAALLAGLVAAVVLFHVSLLLRGLRHKCNARGANLGPPVSRLLGFWADFPNGSAIQSPSPRSSRNRSKAAACRLREIFVGREMLSGRV